MKKNLEAYIAGLSGKECARLLAILQGMSRAKVHGISLKELKRAEEWFFMRMKQAASGRYGNTRTRAWFIFMLLRYGALRMREIMSLKAEECNFISGRVNTGGRNVPISREVATLLGRVWADWPGNSAQYPFRCDQSIMRRSLAQCAEACRFEPERLNGRSLRRLRGLELEAEGLHPRLVAWFLGQKPDPGPFDTELATYILETHITAGVKMKTSARNLFQGQIAEIRENGILVEVIVKTDADLKVSAIITQTSRLSLQLAVGKVVNALVKAPWVSVLPATERAKAPETNCFAGKVDSIKRDNMACEILVSLPQGNRVCALYANGASPEASIADGSEVVVSFSPFSVILTEN